MKTDISIDRWDVKHLSQLLVLFVAIALTPSMLLAEDEDHINGRDKVNDPTGAWLVRISIDPIQREFLLMVFHKGGTITQHFQGESAFDPSKVNDPLSSDNVISSPELGVWQKTGWNTFAATLLDLEYHVLTNPPSSPMLQFAKEQFIGRLTDSGDGMTLFSGPAEVVLVLRSLQAPQLTVRFALFAAGRLRAPMLLATSMGRLGRLGTMQTATESG